MATTRKVTEIKEPLILETDDWEAEEWCAIRKIFNVKAYDARIVIKAPFILDITETIPDNKGDN